jgi:hypothetical protein
MLYSLNEGIDVVKSLIDDNLYNYFLTKWSYINIKIIIRKNVTINLFVKTDTPNKLFKRLK